MKNCSGEDTKTENQNQDTRFLKVLNVSMLHSVFPRESDIFLFEQNANTVELITYDDVRKNSTGYTVGSITVIRLVNTGETSL